MKTKTEVKYERSGTQPRKGDLVVSTCPLEIASDDYWSKPHRVTSIVGDHVNVRKKAGLYYAGDKPSYNLGGFRRGGTNRVLKRKKKTT